MKCQECGQEIDGNEYHPYAFCVLIKAGIDPIKFTYGSVSELGLLNDEGPPIKLARDLRYAVVQQQYDLGNLTEEEARELLSGPLTPGDDTTIFDESGRLVVDKSKLKTIDKIALS